MDINCGSGQKVMSDIMHFGMAYKNYSTQGFGMNVTVRTIDRCSYGMQQDENADWNLEQLFAKECLGQAKCRIYLDLEKVFDRDCHYEMRRRTNGFQFYGPPKVYLLTMCKQESI